MKQSLFDAVGGLPTLKKVHKIFYDKVYAHPWLGKFFEGHKQEIIESQQTAFMGEKMNGPVKYRGKDLKMAHRHMFITEELFQVRRSLLKESLEEVGLEPASIDKWLKIDSAFKSMIVKPSVEAFYHTTWPYEKRLIIPKPDTD